MCYGFHMLMENRHGLILDVESTRAGVKVERDLRINAQLLQTGWKVARVWESAIMKSPEKEAAKVARMVRKRMGNPR